MHVQVAADLADLDQGGQAVLASGLDLAAVLAQLRRDPCHAEPRVHLGLVLAGQHLAGLDLLDAVLAHLEPGPHRRLAQRHVVVLRAGEVLEQVPVDLGRHHAQLDDGAVVRDCGDPVVAPGGDVGDPVLRHERLGRRQAVGHGGDDVDVLAGLGEPADAAGGLAPDDGVAAPELLDDPLGQRQEPADRRAPSGSCGPVLQPLEDRLLGLLPHPAEHPDALGLGCLAHLVDGLELELGEDPPGGLRADARDAHHRGGAGRVALDQLVERGDLAASEQLRHLGGDRLADARAAW